MQVKSNTDRDDFLKSLNERGIGRSMIETELIWKSCCDHALDWLLNKQRPVDMYFIRLHGTILRPGWETMLSRMVFRRIWIDKPTKQVRRSFMGFKITDPCLTALRCGVVEQFVEVEHLSAWRLLSRRIERVRLSVLKPNGYAAAVVERLRNGKAWSIFRFRKWLAHLAASSAEIVYGRADELPSLRESPPPVTVCKFNTRITPFLTVVFCDSGKSTETKNHKKKSLPETYGGLPAVPVVQPKAEDVRDAGTDVSGSEHRPA